MLIKTILNHVEKFKSFVYTKATLNETSVIPELEIEIKERANSRPICSGCGRKSSGYDRLPRRRYEFIPIWGIKVFFS